MEFQLLKRIVALFALAISIAGCTDRIDIGTKDAQPHLVIYGHITSDAMQHIISITRSTGYFANTPPEGISGAIVTITGGGNTFPLMQEEPGVYKTAANVAGISGTDYKLEVDLDFNGDGRRTHYEADCYMPYPATIEDVTLEPTAIIDNHITVLLDATLPDGNNNYYSLHVWRNSEMINDSLSRFTLFGDDNLVTKTLTKVPCFYLDQEDERAHLDTGDRVTVGVDVITKEYADFLGDARDESGGSIPFFGGPPANVKTNISKLDTGDKIPIAGFFSAYPSTRKTVIY